MALNLQASALVTIGCLALAACQSVAPKPEASGVASSSEAQMPAAPPAEPIGTPLQPASPTPHLKARWAIDESIAYSTMERSFEVDAVEEGAFRPPALGRGQMAVHAIDVGQADAFLIEFRCSVALVDTGVQRSGGYLARIESYLGWFFS